MFEDERHQDLWFMFTDLTSRDATYPAGRYVHAPVPKDGLVVLDFNKAYSPPCAFNDFAVCPLPPKQNRLAHGSKPANSNPRTTEIRKGDRSLFGAAAPKRGQVHLSVEFA